VLLDRTGTLSLKTGYAVGDSLPQIRFRAGGPGTVRGYDYGTRVGAGAWSAQLDVALTRSWVLAPVVFADVGDTFRPGRFDPLVGVGGGISLLGGWIRVNGSVGLNPGTDFRFDLLFRAPR
jgi:hemolysin activation/secretion protein